LRLPAPRTRCVRHDVPRQGVRTQHLARLEEVFGAVGTGFECELVEFNGDHDHVQLLVTYPPRVAVAKLVNSLKGVSARRLRREFPALERRLWRGHLWSASYFAGSVGGAPLDELRHYIEDQQAPVAYPSPA